MSRPRRQVASTALAAALALCAAGASAQTASAGGDVSVRAPWGSSVAPQPAQTATFGSALGDAPPTVVAPPPMRYAQLTPMPAPAPAVCSADNRGVRIAAEVGVGLAIDVAAVLAAVIPAIDSYSGLDAGQWALLFGGLYVLSPLSVYLVGQSMGGRGNVWSALLGNMLLSVPGAVVGYEFSAAPTCPPGVEGPVARAPHPRAPGRRTAAATGVSLTATIVPTPDRGGGVLGLGARF